MKTIDNSFCTIFDKTKTDSTYGYCSNSDSWEVSENTETASLKQITIQRKNTRFIGFNQEITRSMTMCQRSSELKDKECDGFSFLKEKDDVVGLLFVELKSQYCKNNISKSIKQMLFSFLKIHSMLSLCDGYSLNNLDIFFCSATLCAKDEAERTKLLDFINKAVKCNIKDENATEKRNAFYECGRIFRDLVVKRKTKRKVKFLLSAFDINLPIHQDIADKDLTIHLSTTNSYNESSSIFSFNSE